MGLCHFLKIWFTPLINQPFKTLLGASNFFKISWTCFSYIISFRNIFSFPPPPKKNCNFWLNILPLDFDFSSGPIVNLIHYSCDSIFFIPHSFLETMQGLMEILLVSRISEFSYLQREKLSRPLHFNLYINHCQE